MDLKKLGEALQQRRETLGLPATTVANRAGIGRTTLWKVERGEDTRTRKPSRLAKDKLERLLAVLSMNQMEQAKLLLLAGYDDDTMLSQQPEQTGESVFTGAYFYPGGEDLEVSMLQEELKQVLEAPHLTRKQRAEMVDLLHSFISWLKFHGQVTHE